MADSHQPDEMIQEDADRTASRTFRSISDRIAEQTRSERLVLFVVRALFLVMLATVTTLTIGARAEHPEDFNYTTVMAIIISTMAVGVIVLAVDYLTPNKRLASTIGVYLGICVGLLGAIAVAKLIDVVGQAWGLFEPASTESFTVLTEDGTRQTIVIPQPASTNPYLELAKVVVGIILCYLAVSFVLTTKDDFRLVIPYVEFAKQVRGIRPMVLDTSVLIDGRIESMVEAGFMDAPLVIPLFVIEELQTLSDSGDRLKRMRGRRGLDVVTRLQKDALIEVSIDDIDVPGHTVDHKLVELARTQQMRILTTDYNLKKVARINGASALNVNDLAAGLKSVVVPGESMEVEIVKPGENEGQGVGYMPDGTMIVVEDAAQQIGSRVRVRVTNSLQTSAGRMIFAKLAADDDAPPGDAAPEGGSIASAARSAVSQPRFPLGERSGPTPTTRRNPRR